MKARVEVRPFADGRIMLDSYLDSDLGRGTSTVLAREMVNTTDKAVRDGLVTLGWTPPGESLVALQGAVESADMNGVAQTVSLFIDVPTLDASPVEYRGAEWMPDTPAASLVGQSFVLMTDGRAYLFDSEGAQRRIDKGATNGSSQSD